MQYWQFQFEDGRWYCPETASKHADTAKSGGICAFNGIFGAFKVK
jgi:hypothetical protein